MEIFRKRCFFVLLVRILLATLFFGQAISLLYSLSGGLLCLLAMVFVQRLLHGHYLFLASMTELFFIIWGRSVLRSY